MGVNAKLSDITTTANLTGGESLYVEQGGNSRQFLLSTTSAEILSSASEADARTAIGISATNTPFTPAGNLSSSDTQSAIEELDTEKASINSPNFTTDIDISGTAPTGSFTESDTTTSAKLLLSGGIFYTQVGASGSGPASSSGKYYVSGWGAADIDEFKVRFGGAWEDVIHTGNAPFAIAAISTSNTAAQNAAAIVAAIETGKRVILPAGEFDCDSVSVTIAVPDDFVIEGAGPQSTILNFGTETYGLRAVFDTAATQMQADKQDVLIKGIGFRTANTGSGSGIHLYYADALSGSDAGSSINRTIENCSFAGETTSAGWAKGIRITNGSYFDIEKCLMRGIEGANTGVFVYLEGSKSSVDNTIRACKASVIETGIEVVGAYEGLMVQNPLFVNCNEGILWNSTANEPWMQVHGGHINAKVAGISADNLSQMLMQGMNIYLNGNSAVGVDMARSAASSGVGAHVIVGNNIEYVSGTNTVGIALAAYCGQSIIGHNRMSGLQTAITLAANCNQCDGDGNLFASIGDATPVTDNGSNNNIAYVDY
jgi:hypothetical protein